MPSYSLTVNGTSHTVNAAADTPLIYVLRNDLNLMATRLGCGMSQCGACAVLADGKEIRSCTTSVSRVAGRKIHTIEGLPGLWAAKTGESSAAIHPVQQAWIDEQVPQCGFCQNGQIMTAKALLSRNPNPSDAEIRQGMANTLCRCMTYYRIQAAIKRAATSMATASNAPVGAGGVV